MEYKKSGELPFSEVATQQLLEHADRAFERRLSLLHHPEEHALRLRWDPKAYLENWPFVGIRMPIDLNFALTLIEVFIPHFVFATLEELSGRPAD